MAIVCHVAIEIPWQNLERQEFGAGNDKPLLRTAKRLSTLSSPIRLLVVCAGRSGLLPENGRRSGNIDNDSDQCVGMSFHAQYHMRDRFVDFTGRPQLQN